MYVAGFTTVKGNPHGRIPVINALTLHRTYSPTFGSAYNAILNAGTAQWLIGQTPEEGAFQFMDSGDVAWHCNGANFCGPGVELHGTNDEPLTDYQVARLHDILTACHTAHGIPLSYQDPAVTPHASIWVNGGGFHGVISHDSVRTDDGTSQHTDMVTRADFDKALGANDMTEDEVRHIIDQHVFIEQPYGMSRFVANLEQYLHTPTIYKLTRFEAWWKQAADKFASK